MDWNNQMLLHLAQDQKRLTPAEQWHNYLAHAYNVIRVALPAHRPGPRPNELRTFMDKLISSRQTDRTHRIQEDCFPTTVGIELLKTMLTALNWGSKTATTIVDPQATPEHFHDPTITIDRLLDEARSTEDPQPSRSSRAHPRHQNFLSQVRQRRRDQIEAETPQVLSTASAQTSTVQNMPAQFPRPKETTTFRKPRKAHYQGDTARSPQEHSSEIQEFLMQCAGRNPFLQLIPDSAAGPVQLGVPPKEGTTIPPPHHHSLLWR